MRLLLKLAKILEVTMNFSQFGDWEGQVNNTNPRTPELKIETNKYSITDDFKYEIQEIMDNYREDFSESNYADYDISMVLERDNFLNIIKIIELDEEISDNEKQKHITFLKELRIDHEHNNRVLKTINFLINIIIER